MKSNEFDRQPLNEMYENWNMTDPHEIRAFIVESMLEWFVEEGTDEFVMLPELLHAYVVALNIKQNESPKMAKLIKQAVKLCADQYQDLRSEDMLTDASETFIDGLEKLAQVGIYPDLMAAMVKSVRATVKADLDQWAKDNPEKLDEEVWDNPNPKKKHKKLSPAKKAAAKARAKRAGRPYPNLIDNMWASKK